MQQPLCPCCHYKTGRWREKRVLFALLCWKTSAFPLGFSRHISRHPRQEETIQTAVGKHICSPPTQRSPSPQPFWSNSVQLATYLYVFQPRKRTFFFSSWPGPTSRTAAGLPWWVSWGLSTLSGKSWVSQNGLKLQWYLCYSKVMQLKRTYWHIGWKQFLI